MMGALGRRLRGSQRIRDDLGTGSDVKTSEKGPCVTQPKAFLGVRVSETVPVSCAFQNLPVPPTTLKVYMLGKGAGPCRAVAAVRLSVSVPLGPASSSVPRALPLAMNPTL